MIRKIRSVLTLIAGISLSGTLFADITSVCPAGMPIGAVQLRVDAGKKARTLPFRGINRLDEGDQITYAPVLRNGEKRRGKVAVVLVPASAIKRQEESFKVLEPKAADKPESWSVPFRSSLAVFVYGPEGLSGNKVKGFLSKDDELIAQLADYAEKTAQTEAVLQALAAYSPETPSENLNAALSGFAGQYGLSNKIDRTAPSDQQAMAIFRSLNPALASYDPIAPSGSQRVGQTTALMATVAGMFFGSTVGLAAGGTAMAMNMKTLLFPNEEFRSSYAQVSKAEAVSLCGKREAVRGHTRIAYLWAFRIPDTGAPIIAIDEPAALAAGLKTPVKVNVDGAQWKLVDRAHDWRLVPKKGDSIPVSVHAVPDQHALEVDLSGAKVPKGEYTLAAKWDWEAFQAKGALTVESLATLSKAHLTPESQNRLVQHTGKKIVQIEGDDFEFVDKVAIVKKGDKYNGPVNVPFSLPKGQRRGPQDRLEMEIDTTPLDAGDYQLLLVQQDGKTYNVDARVVQEAPAIENLPVIANSGEKEQTITLHGRGLDRITGLNAEGVSFSLDPPASGGTERSIRVKLPEHLSAGANSDLKIMVANYGGPLVFPAGFHVAGKRPRLVNSKLSLPAELEISLKPGELPARVFVSMMLHGEHVPSNSSVELSCRQGTPPTIVVRAGTEKNGVKLQSLGNDTLFLYFDPGAWPAGCTINATLLHGREGRSEPFELGRVIRLPRVDSFKLSDEAAGENAYYGTLIGRDLELIEKTGWSATGALPVDSLPSSVASAPGASTADSDKQSLKIKVPWPSPAPHSPLYVCFRGEEECRATTIKN